MNTLSFTRTRLAPTPSGYLHLGNVFSFALTAELARKTGAKVFLRIDDLDRERLDLEFVRDIFETLDFMEIPWDEGPKNVREYETGYSQQHRLPLYEKALEHLKENNKMYACECSRAKVMRDGGEIAYPGTCRQQHIPLDQELVSWRLKTGGAKDLSLKTLNGKLPASLPPAMQDFIVRKKDGLPAYQLASLVDDIHFNVDLVVRGEDLHASTCAQLYLSSLLGKNNFNEVTFHHHSLLQHWHGAKLSKSAGDTSIHYLRSQHKKPGVIYRMIGELAGLKEPVKSREELGKALLP